MKGQGRISSFDCPQSGAGAVRARNWRNLSVLYSTSQHMRLRPAATATP